MRSRRPLSLVDMIATAAAVTVLALVLVIGLTGNAEACNDGRVLPQCTTTTRATTTTRPATTTSSAPPPTTTTRPATTTTLFVGYDLVIPDPPTTTVLVIQLPAVVRSDTAAASPIAVTPRFAG